MWEGSRFLSRNRKNNDININNYNISEISEECKNVSSLQIRFMKSPPTILLNEKMVRLLVLDLKPLVKSPLQTLSYNSDVSYFIYPRENLAK